MKGRIIRDDRPDAELSDLELAARINRERIAFWPRFEEWKRIWGKGFEETYESYCRARGFEPVEKL